MPNSGSSPPETEPLESIPPSESFGSDFEATPPSANSDSLEVEASELDSVEFELESEGSANAE